MRILRNFRKKLPAGLNLRRGGSMTLPHMLWISPALSFLLSANRLIQPRYKPRHYGHGESSVSHNSSCYGSAEKITAQNESQCDQISDPGTNRLPLFPGLKQNGHIIKYPADQDSHAGDCMADWIATEQTQT